MATTGGPRVIDVFDGNGCHRDQINLLFSVADRLSDSLRGRSGVGWSPGAPAPVLVSPRALDPKLWEIIMLIIVLLGTCLDLYPLMEAATHAA